MIVWSGRRSCEVDGQFAELWDVEDEVLGEVKAGAWFEVLDSSWETCAESGSKVRIIRSVRILGISPERRG